MKNEYNAAAHSGFRFSMISLLVGLAMLSGCMTVFRSFARYEFFQARKATHMVPVRGPEVQDTMDRWLTGHGFEPIADPPDRVQSVDPLGQPYANFYVGSYKGSPPFYVSIDPNWDPVDRGIFARSSNVMIYTAADWTVATWRYRSLTELLDEFMDEFHTCCDTLGIFPP